jgi:adenylate cyclase
MPREPATPERGEVTGYIYTSLLLRLAGNDIEGAWADAERYAALLRESPKRYTEIYIMERSIQAFLRAGAIEQAEQLLATAVVERFKDHPLLWRARAAIHLARKQPEQARPLAEKAVDVLEQAEFTEEEWPSRRLLAQVLVALGDRSMAETELGQVLNEAEKRSHMLEAGMARQQLSALGVKVAEPAPAPISIKVAPEIRQPSERLVTVMFLDVRGYTALSTREAPELLASQISLLYTSAEAEIRRHDGMVDRYAGDAVMATFNVTGMRLDHTLQALQAALAVRDRAAFTGLSIGIGIAVGPAVVGQFSQGSSVTAVGETINLASRLQASAGAGEILLSEEAYRRTRDWLESQEQAVVDASLDLKGFSSPVRAYRLPTQSTAPATQP